MSSDTRLEAASQGAVTEADVMGFAAKLEAWCETLAPGEQALLDRLLACAEGVAAGESEVEGYTRPGVGARVTHLFAAGLVGVTLAVPLAAPVAASAATEPSVGNTQHANALTPEEISQ